MALIPARGGSKGLPGKNIRLLAGKPLIAHTIAHALSSERVSRVIVSTDCPDIAAVARESGAEVPFLRPAELAQDQTSSAEVFLHASQVLGSDEMVVLQPTSPVRRSFDIDQAISQFEEYRPEAIISCVRGNPPGWCCAVENGWLNPLWNEMPLRRQEAREVVYPNGSIYVFRVEALHRRNSLLSCRARVHLMPNWASVDIDELDDFLLAEAILTSGLFRQEMS